MQTEYLQSLRYKLQKRVRRIKSVGWQQYMLALRQFWTFFDSEPTLLSIGEELLERYNDGNKFAQRIEQELQAKQTFEYLDDEVHWASVSLRILRRFAELGDPRAASSFVLRQSNSSFDAYLDAFNACYLDPFYEYLDERLDHPRFLLARLVRFKHLCEWFWRDDLLEKWTNNSARGEKLLAMKLYEFLFTEGVNVHIEPSSVSGEADMVGSQEGPERLIADAKVFNPEKSKGKAYIIQGFRQIYQYTADYNESIGYLVIFNTGNKQLRFVVAGQGQPVPHVSVNHKAIFFLVVDLYAHDTPASKRPEPEVVEISETEIIGTAAQTALTLI